MDELLLRQMPHSLEGEQAVLGSMLIDPACVKDVMDLLHAEDFYHKQNRNIFETIYRMFLYSKPIDGLTVAEELQKNGLADDSTRAYLAQLMDVTPTSANVLEYAEIIRSKSLLRSIAVTAEKITAMVQDGTGDAHDTLEAAEQLIFAIRNGRDAQTMTPVSHVIPAVLEGLSLLAERGGELPGLPTGFSTLDDKISGLNDSDLIILAARPGMGKTSLALNIALHAAKTTSKAVAVFSLEMSKEQLVTRLLSSEALVESNRLRSGNLRDSDWAKLAAATSVVSKAKILIDDNPLISVADINAKCRRIDGLGLVVIDYLQLMNAADNAHKSREGRVQVISEITRMLKIMAKELNVPVICLSQLSRANEKREDRRPMLSDLRDSGSVEQDADIVLLLYRDDYYKADSEKRNTVELNIAKNRHGETGKLELRWLPEYTSFGVLETRYEEE